MTVPIEEPSAAEKTVVGWVVKTFLFRIRKDKGRKMPAHLGAKPVQIRGNSGARLLAHVIPAAHAHPKGVVVLAHPDRRYAQHWFVRTGWIDDLRAAGYAVVTFDFVRYGGSRGGSTYLHDDLIPVAEHARKTFPGTPVHVIGVSIGSFAAANASPRLDFVESLMLESPYPTFIDWYAAAEATPFTQAVNNSFNVFFKKTARRIQATTNIAHAAPKRILITAMADDKITPLRLTQEVAQRAPVGRSHYLELAGVGHLDAYETRPEYRAAVLAHLANQPVLGAVSVENLVPGRAASKPKATPSDHPIMASA